MQFPTALSAPFQCLPKDKFLYTKYTKGGREVVTERKERGREGRRKGGGTEGRGQREEKISLSQFMCRINYKPKVLYCMIPISFNKSTVKK